VTTQHVFIISESDVLSAVSVLFGYRSSTVVDCVVNVVSELCGDETGELVRALIARVMSEMDCTRRARQ